MTELEQKLLSALEQEREEREKERQELKQEREQIMKALSLILREMEEIKSALNRPPQDGGLEKVLDQALSKFSDELKASLVESLEKSNNDLIDAILSLEKRL